MAKWDDQWGAWAKDYKDGMNFPQLEKKYGVRASTINSVLTNKHVHEPIPHYVKQKQKMRTVKRPPEPKPPGPKPEWNPRMDWKPIEALSEKIVLPGIERHLEPLLHFRGSANFGRIHRLWNFILACQIQGCEEKGDITKMSHHPDYSHLCGTTKRQQMSSVVGFLNRLRMCPEVTDNIPELTEWVEHIHPNHWIYPRVSKYAGHKDCAWWRTYRPVKKKIIKGGGNIKQQGSDQTLCYPYIAHDPKKDGMDLVTKVNNAVPKHLPEEFRADICQDIICAILMGDMSEEDLQGDIKKFVTEGRKIFSNKWDFVSINAPIPGTDGATFEDVIAAPEEWSFA